MNEATSLSSSMINTRNPPPEWPSRCLFELPGLVAAQLVDSVDRVPESSDAYRVESRVDAVRSRLDRDDVRKRQVVARRHELYQVRLKRRRPEDQRIAVDEGRDVGTA